MRTKITKLVDCIKASPCEIIETEYNHDGTCKGSAEVWLCDDTVQAEVHVQEYVERTPATYLQPEEWHVERREVFVDDVRVHFPEDAALTVLSDSEWVALVNVIKSKYL